MSMFQLIARSRIGSRRCLNLHSATSSRSAAAASLPLTQSAAPLGACADPSFSLPPFALPPILLNCLFKNSKTDVRG
jgi:hypothetical protein